MIQNPPKSKVVFLKLQTFTLMLFSYSSNIKKAKNKRQTLQSWLWQMLPIHLCCFQVTTKVHQTFNLKDHIYSSFFQFPASWLFWRVLQKCMETGSSSDSTETRLNFDISNITVKKHEPNTMADWIMGLPATFKPQS